MADSSLLQGVSEVVGLAAGAGPTFTQHSHEGCSRLRIQSRAVSLLLAFVSITASELSRNAFGLHPLHIPAMPTELCYNFSQCLRFFAALFPLAFLGLPAP